MRTPPLLNRRVYAIASIVLAGALVARGFAQTADAQDATDVVVLSEFTVSTDADDSYIASETVTGSRVAVKIKDLPYVVNVVTREFLDDFAFFEVEEEFAYASSFGGLDAGGGFNIRGLGATKSLRDGFQRFGLLDRVTVDRVEIIKGPAAAIYGETRPGGLINVISKQPRSTPQYRISVNAGSMDTLRTDVGATGPVGNSKKTFYTIDAGMVNREFEQPYAYNRQRTAAASVKHKFSDNTTLQVTAETLSRRSRNADSVPLIDLGSSAGTGRYPRLAYELTSLPISGPDGGTDREIAQFFATFEHRINRTWTVRAAGSYYHRHYWTYGTGGGNLNPVTGLIRKGEPGFGKIDEDGGGFQVDALAHYWTNNRKVEHRTLFTIDYNTYWRVDPQWRMRSGNASVVRSAAWYEARGELVRNFDPLNPVWLFPEFTQENYPRFARWRDNRVDTIGTFLRHQSAALNGRLIMASSLRYDQVRFRLKDRAAASTAGDPSLVTTANYNIDDVTPSAGFNFKVKPDIALYVNYSESFFPDSQNVNVGNPNPPEGGYGFDYGFKITALEDKLNFTIGGFHIKRTNVGVNVFDEESQTTIRQFIGDQKAQGFEFDANWQPVAALTLLFGYGYTDSANTNLGLDLNAKGRRSPRVPLHNAYLALRYNVNEGPLKGLRFNLGTRHTSSTFPFTTDGGITEPATINGQPNPNRGLILSHDGRRDIKLPGFTVVDFGLSYSWRADDDSRVNHTVSFNIKNLLDDEYLLTNRRPGDPRGYYGGYSIRF